MSFKWLAVIALVAVPMLVEAECGWVLWRRSQEPGWRGRWNGPAWEAIAAYTSKAECEDPLDPFGLFESKERAVRGTVEDDIVRLARRRANLDLKCLPVGVDPRPLSR